MTIVQGIHYEKGKTKLKSVFRGDMRILGMKKGPAFCRRNKKHIRW